MLSTCALMVDSLSPDCLSQVSKPSRIGWFAPCITWTHCSYDSASSASVMQPLSFRSAILLSLVSPSRQDRLAILEKKRCLEFDSPPSPPTTSLSWLHKLIEG